MGPDDPADLKKEEAATPTTAPAPAPSSTSAQVVANTGTETKSGGAVVKTLWPHGSFHIENIPTVTREGVELSGDQLERVKAAAKAQDVRIHVVGGGK
jgi:hypothetical protein